MLYLIAFATLLIMPLYPMDTASKLCNNLKNIPYDASLSVYINAAQDLKNNSLSTCECMQILMEEKRLRKKKELEEKFAIPMTSWHKEEAATQKVLELDRKNASLTFDAIAEEDQKLIKHLIKEKNIQAPIHVTQDLEAGSSYVRLSCYNHQFILGLNADYYKGDKKGLLLHELHHIEKRHNDYSQSLFVKVGIKHHLNFQQTTNAYQAFNRYQETEADRIPAACGSCKDAQAVKAQSSYNFFNEPRAMLDFKSTHPTLRSRYQWATRIAQLKQAEEYINKPGQFGYFTTFMSEHLKKTVNCFE